MRSPPQPHEIMKGGATCITINLLLTTRCDASDVSRSIPLDPDPLSCYSRPSSRRLSLHSLKRTTVQAHPVAPVALSQETPP